MFCTMSRRSILAALLASSLAHPALAEPVTIEVASWKGNEAEPAGMAKLIAKFEAENPGIKVNLVYVSRNDTDTVVSPRVRGDNPPDVIMTDPPLLRQWGDAGLLAELEKSTWFDRIPENLRVAVAIDDKAYVFPLEVIGIGNFVNMGLLRKVGIDAPPTTIDALKVACGKLADAGINPLIMAPGYPSSVLMMGLGLQLDPNPPAEIGRGERKFADTPAYTEALQIIRDLETARCFNGAEQAGVDAWSTGLAEFSAGNFAMMPQGAWNITAFSAVEGLDFVFAPLPGVREPGVALDLFGFGWAIAAKSAHPEESKAFVEFFNNDENLNILLRAEAAYSPFTGGLNGTPPLAAAYEAARNGGGLILQPVALLEWPLSVELEINSGMAGFLADPSMAPADLLQRLDEMVEDSL